MRHARPEDLSRLEPLLAELDDLVEQISPLKARKIGVYYLKSKAFLHFHVLGEDLFADVKLDGTTFERFNVTSRQRQKDLVSTIKCAIKE